MQKRFILFSLLAAVALVAFVAVSLIVYAIGIDSAAAQSDEVTTLEAIEAAPVQAEPVVIESQVKYEGHTGGGCSRSVQQMMTHKTDKETIEAHNEPLLTQVRP
jgi:hypothetical protein